jgi:hypothetical protein
MIRRSLIFWIPIVVAVTLGPALPVAQMSAQTETGTGASRERPLPFGATGTLGNIEIRVVSVIPDANDVIAEASGDDAQPPAGKQFFMVRIAMTNTRAQRVQPMMDVSFHAVGNSNVGYGNNPYECGYVPESQLDAPDLFEGASTEFNVCWVVDTTDVGSLVMYAERYSAEAGPEERWFSLDPETADQETAEATPFSVGDGLKKAQSSTDDTPDEVATPSVEGEGESQENPVPLGATKEVGTLYDVRVVSVTSNADQVILDENPNNEAPPDGQQFFLVRVALTYTGTEIGSPANDLTFVLIGDSGTTYVHYETSCGVAPDDVFLATDLFPGGTAEYGVCWAISTDDANASVMYVLHDETLDPIPVYFSLLT